MKVMLFVAIVLLACCMQANAWGRRNEISGGINRNGASASWTSSGDRWSTSVHGNIDRNGNWGAGASISYRWRRSDGSNEQSLYNVTLQVDPCDYNTYDIDRNGEIILGELHAIFGESEMAEKLFKDLDKNKSGALGVSEFYDRVPLFIGACADVDSEEED